MADNVLQGNLYIGWVANGQCRRWFLIDLFLLLIVDVSDWVQWTICGVVCGMVLHGPVVLFDTSALFEVTVARKAESVLCHPTFKET